MIRPAQVDDTPVLVKMMGEFYEESHYSLDPAWATRNVLAVHVEASAGNEAAQAIYRELGFRGNELQRLTALVRKDVRAS